MGAVDIKLSEEQELTLEWDSSASNDMIADSTLALINGIDKSPASVKRKSQITFCQRFSDRRSSTVTTHPHTHDHVPKHPHPHADLADECAERMRIQRLAWFLEAHFGEVELHMPEEGDEMEQGEDAHEPSLLVTLDEADAVINLLSMVSLQC